MALSWMKDDLAECTRQGLYRVERRLQSSQGVRIRLRHRELINFGSNDYLGLAADPRLARAAMRAARRYGTGAGASPLVCGLLPPQRRLARALARWEDTEAAVVFASGFAANFGLVAALAGPKDVLFSDALNHASLIDGCRLARAGVHIYRHADVNHLEDLLRQHTGRRRFLVTDSVFSMDGDWAPLPELLDLAQRYDCAVILDEAHATGVLGKHGRGLTELLSTNTGAERLIKVGTLSKALGAQGGFVCGPQVLADWLIHFARPYVFSTALAPPSAAAAQQAVAIVQQEPERRCHLLALAQRLRNELQAIGFATGVSRCQIIPIVIGDASATVELSHRLEEHGLLVPAIRPPSVPVDTARLRVSLTAAHTHDDVMRLVQTLQLLRG